MLNDAVWVLIGAFDLRVLQGPCACAPFEAAGARCRPDGLDLDDLTDIGEHLGKALPHVRPDLTSKEIGFPLVDERIDLMGYLDLVAHWPHAVGVLDHAERQDRLVGELLARGHATQRDRKRLAALWRQLKAAALAKWRRELCALKSVVPTGPSVYVHPDSPDVGGISIDSDCFSCKESFGFGHVRLSPRCAELQDRVQFSWRDIAKPVAAVMGSDLDHNAIEGPVWLCKRCGI